MNEIRKPLKKSILKGIGVFTLVLCTVLVIAQLFFLRGTLYSQYETRMTHILRDAENAVRDTAELDRCIRTGQKSPWFERAQGELNAIKERTGVMYLYIIIPENTEDTDNIRNVMAAVTREEAGDPAAYVELNGLSGDSYPRNVAQKYMEAYGKDGISFFTNSTVFGTDYTGMLVLKHPVTGERVAALCADFNANEINDQIRENLLDILIIVIIVGLLFATLFMMWVDRYILRPIRTVEQDVVDLARKSHTSRNPDAMVYSAEGIRTGNEVESLARAVEQLSLDMRDYVKNLVEQEKEVARLNSVANRDPLTRVGNRHAYNLCAEGLQLKMTEGRFEFGILLADARGLRRINEAHGHDKGDAYLQKVCRIVCEVFRHSPVFRMEGDVFAAVLQGEDYINRRALAEEAQTAFYQASSDERLAPWEQVRASFGMAEYDPGKDRTVREVYQRADKELREAKGQ